MRQRALRNRARGFEAADDHRRGGFAPSWKDAQGATKTTPGAMKPTGAKQWKRNSRLRRRSEYFRRRWRCRIRNLIGGGILNSGAALGLIFSRHYRRPCWRGARPVLLMQRERPPSEQKARLAVAAKGEDRINARERPWSSRPPRRAYSSFLHPPIGRNLPSPGSPPYSGNIVEADL